VPPYRTRFGRGLHWLSIHKNRRSPS
jgi:hypothetical protein